MRFRENLSICLPLAVMAAWAIPAVLAEIPAEPAEVPARSAEVFAGSDPADRLRPSAADADEKVASICPLVESAAQAHALPAGFFARLIWEESRFDPGKIGPATHNGQHAQGIAQFMPDTAKERGVLDPFDPVAALPKSAEFLHELHTQFGNLGLAAAAYNAGPKRVRDWLAGRTSLPGQTRSYVSAITGRSADEWAPPPQRRRNGQNADRRPPDDQHLATDRRNSCSELAAMLKTEPTLLTRDLGKSARDSAALPQDGQLSAGFGHERALGAYASTEKSDRSMLANRDSANQEPIIIESKFRNRGAQLFYQVRVGTDTRASADGLCDALRRAGNVCVVLRNPEAAQQSL